MKIKQLFKKAFTMVELVIVIAAVAVLAATSVGIYFGVMNGNATKEAITIQEQVLNLWNSYLNGGLDYLSPLENKTHDFCTSYANKKGIEVKMNYRVLKFEENVNSIIEKYNEDKKDSQIDRAYDPGNDSNELAIIKIETEFPSYFISTRNTVIDVTKPFSTTKELIDSVYSNFFVNESYVKEYYEKEYNADDFSEYFFDLSDIIVNQETKETVRGLRYIRYDVYNTKNDYYKTVFGKANRTLNQEAGGTYTPSGNQYDSDEDSIFVVDEYNLIENIDGDTYHYDPNHLYDYDENVYNSELEKIVYTDDGQEVIKEANILPSKYQYLVSKRTINFVPVVEGGNTGPTTPGEGATYPDFDISKPFDPDSNVGTEGSEIDSEQFPITLMFGSKVSPNGNSKIINWLKTIFGIYDDAFQFLYFKDFKTLNDFINSEEFSGLVPVSVGGDTTKIVFINGKEVIVKRNMVWPEKFIFTLDSVYVDNMGEREESHKLWYDQYKKSLNPRNINEEKRIKTGGPNRSYVYPKAINNRYESTFGREENSIIIAENTIMEFNPGSSMYIEGVLHACTSTSGFQVGSYSRVENNGVITFKSKSGLRVNGIIDGNGTIIAQNDSTISEPFKVTDWLGKETTNNEFVNKETFFSDFYYLDSIRCKLEINQGSNYRGYTPYYYLIDDGAFKYDSTVFCDFDIISNENEANLFSVHENSKIIKSCDQNGKTTLRFEKGLIQYNSVGFDSDWEIYFMLSYLEDSRPTVKAFDDFNNGRTGFKLSNINIIVGGNTTQATFNMSDYEKIDGEWRSGKLEVLPSSSIHITKNGSLELQKQNALILNDFYANSEMYNIIKTYTGNNDVLARFDILNNLYKNSSSFLFKNEGTISIDDAITSENRKEVKYIEGKYTCPHTKSQCHEQHNTGGYWDGIIYKLPKVTRDCDKEIINNKEYTYTYFTSSIFCWSKEKVVGMDKYSFKDTFTSNLLVKENYEIIKHEHRQDKCPEKFVDIHVTLKYIYSYNSFLYKNKAYPIYEIRNKTVSINV